MAAGSELKKQMLAIRNISKITKAMELVATAKLKKLTRNISASQVYFQEVYAILQDIINAVEHSIYNWSEANDRARSCFIVITSNLGLCGGYNLNITKILDQHYKQGDYLIVFGQKGDNFCKNQKHHVDELYVDFNNESSYQFVQKISNEILAQYQTKVFANIHLIYTKFINNVTFEPALLTLLPIKKQTDVDVMSKSETEFEPNATTVLKFALPLYVSAIIYSSLLESQLAEFASRRNAMENATKNASEMIEKLNLAYNRKRQASITQEILEIIAGANAQQ